MDVSVPRKEKMLVGMVPCAGGGGGRQMGDGVVGMSDGAMRKQGRGGNGMSWQCVSCALGRGADTSLSFFLHRQMASCQGKSRWGTGIAVSHQAAVVLTTSSCSNYCPVWVSFRPP